MNKNIYWEQERDKAHNYIDSFKVVRGNVSVHVGLSRKEAITQVDILNAEEDTKSVDGGTNFS